MKRNKSVYIMHILSDGQAELHIELGSLPVLVVEDTSTNEIRRFFVVDARVGLGSIELGSQKREFDPNRMLRFFELVENQLHEFSSKYPESFRYLPRRAYDYLRKPPILGELYSGFPEYGDTCWFIDQFFVHPILNVGDAPLPNAQQKTNIDRAHGWTDYPPFAPRLYHLQEMRYGHQSRPGWACILRASDLKSALSGQNRNDLLDYLGGGLPLLVEIEHREDLDAFLQWLVFLRDADVETPTVLLAIKSHKEWGKEIVRLLDIPNTKILTSGSTIASLTDIVRHLKTTDGDLWSTRIIFASSYPATQAGNSLSEIICFLLSSGLDAKPSDLHRILGGNLLALLPPRPRALKYVNSDTAVAAEGLLGKTAMNELSRMLRILATRGLQAVVSCDFMVKDDGEIDTRSAILTIKESSSKDANAVGIVSERNESIRLSGWRQSFSDSLKHRNANLLLTLVRGSTIATGLILDAPSQLGQFNYSLLECLRVKNPYEILSALHFETQVGDHPKGSISMNPEDLEGLEAKEGDILVALEATTGQWWVVEAIGAANCPVRTVLLSSKDAEILGIGNTAMIDLTKYQGSIVDIRSAWLAFSTKSELASSELLAYVHLNEEEILTKLDGLRLGRGTKLEEHGLIDLTLELMSSNPFLQQGQVGTLSRDSIILRPAQTYKPLNILLCVSTDTSMLETDIDFRGMETIKRKLATAPLLTPELKRFVNSLSQRPTRAQLAALTCLIILNNIMGNRTDGRFGFVTFSDKARKFAIQKGERVLNHMEFHSDFASEEARVSLVYSILDTMEETGGKAVPSEAFRSIVEILEDFGAERPTLVLFLTSQVSDETGESEPFLQALKQRNRFLLDVLCFNPKCNLSKTKEILSGVNSRILPVDRFSEYLFEGYFLDTIDRLVHHLDELPNEIDTEETR
ncbi:MAG: hypothetical protein EAX95_09530 [Candidatus Thorarchaeota archaeon]|nr:hypothetical protein [Candidatus Thorarchaeota archaeon]